MAGLWINTTVKAMPFYGWNVDDTTVGFTVADIPRASPHAPVSIPFPSHEPLHAPKTSHFGNLSTMTFISELSSFLHTALFFLSIRFIVLRDNVLHQLLTGKNNTHKQGELQKVGVFLT